MSEQAIAVLLGAPFVVLWLLWLMRSIYDVGFKHGFREALLPEYECIRRKLLR